MARDMKEKKCGCIIFEVGPPVLCGKHQSKVDRKEKREKLKEEKGLRKLVLDKAIENGHDLSRFKEYGSRPGKWVAHCHACGAMVIVYDAAPEYGDQIAGPAVFKTCHKSDLVGTLGAAEREAIAARFAGGTEADGTDVDDDELSTDADGSGIEA